MHILLKVATHSGRKFTTGTLNETTKTGRIRSVSIPRKVHDILLELLFISPWQSPDAFIFFSTQLERKPMEGKIATKGLYAALKSIGIDKAQRESRCIEFHSWRHWFNSILINKLVPLQKVQAITGHLSNDMTANYYHLDDMADIREIQEGLLIKL